MNALSEKIRPEHLSRKAILYIRQSTSRQVIENQESRRLQYAMKEHLRSLGWREIDVVDEDLGKSAGGAVDRSGFDRMVAEVCLKKVGAVAARELSRFARNSTDWQHLIDVCRVVDTLLIDQEAVYDARQTNDRLLLGLKGTLNEYELDVLRMRGLEARNEKARRGDLICTLPAGYVAVDGQIVMDPDLRVQEAVRLVFKRFFQLGSARQTALWFIDNGLDLPTRELGGKLVWKRASYPSVLRFLRHPVYAGAYTFGRRQVTSEFHDGKLRKRFMTKPMEQWLSLIYDHHEGYIAREEFERIQKMIARNSPRHSGVAPGAPKRGAALLAGMLRCRRCGHKMAVQYTGPERTFLRYQCPTDRHTSDQEFCIGFSGIAVDEVFANEILRVVRPGAIEATVLAAQDTGERDEVLSTLRLEHQQASYAAQRAWKQYDAVDPENRLVAGELERRWNFALEKVRELESRIQEKEACKEQQRLPSHQDFCGLAEDLDRVWHDPATDVRLKKRILRTLIEEVIADLDDETNEIVLVAHWKGGVHSELRLRRNRRGYSSAHTAKDVLDAIRVLALVFDDSYIAAFLTRNRLRTGMGKRWTGKRVYSMRHTHGIPGYTKERQEKEGWLNLAEAGAFLGIDGRLVRKAAERGEIETKHPLPDGPWIFKRDHLEGPAGQKIKSRARKPGTNRPADPPEQLTLF